MNLILSGPPCSGKSYYGARLAEWLKCTFVDSDRLIEERHALATGNKVSCCEIHLHEGESSFRKKEKAAILSLKHTRQAVIALGGGVLLDPENAGYLKSLGTIAFLKTDFDVLWKRLKSRSPWPSYIDLANPQASFRAVVAKRNAICVQHADLIIETKHHSDQEIMRLLLQGTHG